MNAGEIAKRLLENKWALTFGEQAALASSYQEAEKALRDVLDVAIWMSGSPSFGPEGEAHEGWVKARPKLDAAAAFLAEQG
jgi:hypothetical protein